MRLNVTLCVDAHAKVMVQHRTTNEMMVIGSENFMETTKNMNENQPTTTHDDDDDTSYTTTPNSTSGKFYYFFY